MKTEGNTLVILTIENYKLIAIDLSKQESVNADSKTIQQAYFTGNLDGAGNTTRFFIT